VFGEDDHVELITGHVVEMSPQNAAHATAIRLIAKALRDHYTSYLVDVQLPLALSADSAPEPDIAVIEGTPADFVEAHPDTALLVVEVSSRSLAFDRGEKQRVYARAEIPTYWIANLVEGVLEVYTDPTGGRYRTVRTLEAGDAAAVPGTDATLPAGDLLP
jgi:Uma2 family endonuclease